MKQIDKIFVYFRFWTETAFKFFITLLIFGSSTGFGQSDQVNKIHFSFSTEPNSPVNANTRGVFLTEQDCLVAFEAQRSILYELTGSEQLNGSCIKDNSIKPRYILIIELNQLVSVPRERLFYIRLNRTLYWPTLKNQIVLWMQDNEKDLELRFSAEVSDGIFVYAKAEPSLRTLDFKTKTIEDCLNQLAKISDQVSVLINRKTFLSTCDASNLVKEHDVKGNYPVPDKKLWQSNHPESTVQKIKMKYGFASKFVFEHENYHPLTGNRLVPIYALSFIWINFPTSGLDSIRHQNTYSMGSKFEGYDSLQDCQSHLPDQDPKSRTIPICAFSFLKGYFKYQIDFLTNIGFIMN